MRRTAAIITLIGTLAAGCSGGGGAGVSDAVDGAQPPASGVPGGTPPGAGANKPPLAVSDTALTTPDTMVFIDVLGNDTDGDGDVLALDLVSLPASGAVSVSDSGSPTDPTDDFITYMPAPGFLGADSFDYSVSDGEATSVASVNLLVTGASSTATPGTAVCGSVVKAHVRGAVVSLHAVNANGQPDNGAPLAQALTDADGNWCTKVPDVSRAYLVTASGGSFVDESDTNAGATAGRRITLAPHEALQTLLPPNESYVAVTVFSNAVLERARTRTSAGDFLAQFDDSRLRLTLALGLDPIATPPADPAAPEAAADEASRRYAMALGGVANAMNNIAVSFGQTVYNHPIIEALGRDLSDCNLDGLATSSPLQVSVNGVLQALPGYLNLNTEILRFRNNRSSEYGDTPVARVDAGACLPPVGADLTPPLITGVPANLKVAATDASGTAALVPAIAAFLSAPRAVDSHDGTLPVTNDAPPSFGLGITTVNFVAVDSQANTTTVSATITVADMTAPTVIAPADVVTSQAGTLTAVATGTATASDNVSDASRLVITSNAPADGFAVGTTTVTWTVRDAARNVGTATQRITVTPAGNAVPAAVADSLTVAEGGTTSVLDGGATSLLDNDTDADGDTLRAALLVPPSSGVVLIGADGQFSYMHDGSNTASDSFSYVAIDDWVESTPATVSVTITPVNDAPVFSSAPVTTATEDVQYSYAVAATDTDGDPLTLSAPVLPAWLSFSDNGDGTARLEGIAANGAVGSHAVSLAVSDGIAPPTLQSFSITVANTNDAPIAVFVTPNQIPENLPAGSTVGTLSTSDVDVGDVHTYTLVAGVGDTGNSSFTISGDQLLSAVSFDFETQANYSVRVRVKDGNNSAHVEVLTISIVDVGDSATGIALSQNTVAENLGPGQVIGTLATTGASGPRTYTLVAGVGDSGNAAFSVSGDQLLSAQSFNHEAQSVYSVRLQSDDGNGDVISQVLSVSVTNRNDAPVFVSTPVTAGSNGAAYIYTAHSTDQDADPLSLSAPTLPAWLTFVDNGDGTADLTGVPGSGDVGMHAVVIQVSDGIAAPVQQSFTVTVVSTNNAPTGISLSNNTIVEHVGTAVGTFSTTDVDAGDTHSYSLVPGTGAVGNGAFTIVGNQLRPAVEMDFESQSSYSVRVRTDDGNTGTFDAVFAITVIDGNDPPTSIGISNLSIDENLPANSLVATLSTVDPNPDTHTYSLVAGSGSSNNGDFVIFGNELRTSRPLNFESGATRNIRLRSSDGALSVDATSTIMLNNVNDAPTVLSTATPQYAVQGLAMRYEFSSDDEDTADSLTVTATTLPAWLTLVDRGNGEATLSGTPAPADAGSNAVALRVDDDGAPSLNAVQNFSIEVVLPGADTDFDGVPDDVEALTGGQIGPAATNVINVSSGTTNAALGTIPAGSSAQNPTYVLYQANVPVASSNNWNLDLDDSCDNIVFWGSLSGMSTSLSAGGAPTTEFEVNSDDVATIDQCDNVQFHNIGFTGGTDSGLIMKKGQVVLDNVRIYGNSATEGGGIFAQDTDLRIKDSVIADNIGWSAGGGMYIKGGNSKLTLRNSIVSGNYTAFDGGGFYFKNVADKIDIVNNLIVGNMAFSFGGGFYYKGADSVIANNTVAYNMTNQGPGLYYDSGGGPVLTDNIFYFNRRRNGSTVTYAGGVNASMSMYNLIEGAPVGTGDVNIAAAGPNWQSGYYLNQATSVGVNTGSTLAWLVGLDDHYTDGSTGAPVTDSGAFPGPGQVDRGFHFAAPTNGPADSYTEVEGAPNSITLFNGGVVPLVIEPTRLGANLGRGHRLIATLPGPNANLADLVANSWVDPLGDGESVIMTDMGNGTHRVMLYAQDNVGAPTPVQLRIQIDGVNMPQLFDITRRP